jgi:hypothetical protein
MLWKNRKDYSKKLFRLNSSVMDDNHETYKTANIKIDQHFLHAWIKYLIWLAQKC